MTAAAAALLPWMPAAVLQSPSAAAHDACLKPGSSTLAATPGRGRSQLERRYARDPLPTSPSQSMPDPASRWQQKQRVIARPRLLGQLHGFSLHSPHVGWREPPPVEPHVYRHCLPVPQFHRHFVGTLALRRTLLASCSSLALHWLVIVRCVPHGGPIPHWHCRPPTAIYSISLPISHAQA